MPKKTVRVLKQLVEYGLTDEQFRIVHHVSGNTIRAHISYCDGIISNFQEGDSTNLLVRRRLVHMRQALRASESLPPARPEVLEGLAREALAAIPML